jgi:hypothetical protein
MSITERIRCTQDMYTRVCLRLVTALCVEHSEEWVTGRRYLDMEELRESRRAGHQSEEVALMKR